MQFTGGRGTFKMRQDISSLSRNKVLMYVYVRSRKDYMYLLLQFTQCSHLAAKNQSV